MRVRRWTGLAVALLWSLPLPVAAQQKPPGYEHDAPAFTFNRIVEGVYHAVGTGSMSVGANSVAIINDSDVVLVDSHVSPAAATALLDELRQITDKPVRDVVDTHYHFDHAHGNQVYAPGVEIIGHGFTHAMLAGGASVTGKTWTRFIATLPAQIAALKAQLDTTTSAADRVALGRRIKIQESYQAATDAVRPTPPNVTFDHELTLYRGSREIRIEFLGRGHTGGDVVVYLPRERILAGGDLVSTQLPYMGDGYVPDWIETLERMKQLDFDVILPGHGPAFRGKERIDQLQQYLLDFWGQVVKLHHEGVSAIDAAQRVDMRAHAKDFPSIRGVGVDLDAVLGAYEVIAGVR